MLIIGHTGSPFGRSGLVISTYDGMFDDVGRIIGHYERTTLRDGQGLHFTSFFGRQRILRITNASLRRVHMFSSGFGIFIVRCFDGSIRSILVDDFARMFRAFFAGTLR